MGMPMIASGVGIYTSGAVSKAWQAQAEAKKMAATAANASPVLPPPPTNLEQVGGPNADADPINT
jgi:hypothetical protein